MITITQRNILSFNNAMNSIVNWQDGGRIVNLYCVKVIKNGIFFNFLREKSVFNIQISLGSFT